MSGAAPSVRGDDDGRSPLFVCGAGPDAGEGMLSLTAIESGSGTARDLGFTRSTGDHADYTFAPPASDDKTAFRFAHSNGPEGYLVTLRFADGGADYMLYSLNAPPAAGDDTDVGAETAGLIVRRGNATMANIVCGESPTLFVSDIRAATGCDATTSEGTAACSEDPPLRTAPLDRAAIGLSATP